MFPLPEWAPNVHPLIVHFPIAILFVAALSDLLALTLRRWGWLRLAATGLYVLGALSALAAFLTGRDAVEGMLLSVAANPVLTEHADWAERSVWFYGLLATARMAAEWRRLGTRLIVHLPLALAGAFGLLLIAQTAERGAQMVYQHGVGVSMAHLGDPDAHAHNRQEAPEEEAIQHAHAEGSQEAHHGALLGGQANSGTGLQHLARGGWHWSIEKGAEAVLEQRFEWLDGSAGDMRPDVVHDAGSGQVLALRPTGAPAMFVTGSQLGSLQFDIRLNADGFTGAVRLLHHVRNPGEYSFMELDGTTVRLGHLLDGETRIDDTGTADASGWQPVRVVSDGTHFRGYVGSKMVVHGHGKEPEPGRVGLLVDGTGVLVLGEVKVQPLR